MDIQFYGANCLSFTRKDVRVVIDDNLAELGGKSVVRKGDIALYTYRHPDNRPSDARMVIDTPGEYEVGQLSITGVAARGHMAEDEKAKQSTMYKLTAGEVQYLVTGHIFPSLSDDDLEEIGIIDVMFIPIGGNGFTLDPVGALKLIKDIEPKLVVPTHYADKELKYEVPQQDLETALKEIGIEVKERVSKLKLKAADLSDVTQLIVLEKS